jgi:hypothetical protein
MTVVDHAGGPLAAEAQRSLALGRDIPDAALATLWM